MSTYGAMNNDDNDIEVKTEGTSSQKKNRTRCPVVVEPVILLATLFSFASILLSQLFVLKKFGEEVDPPSNLSDSTNSSDFNQCTVNLSDPHYRHQEMVQAKASFFSIMVSVVTSVPSLFVSLFLPAYSDKAGRKYAITVPIIGGLLRSIVYVVVMATNASLWLLLIGNFLEGCAGSFIVLLNSCFSYIADTTSTGNRMFRVTVLELCLYVSAIIGPIGVTQWLSQTGYLLPFLVILGGNVLLVFYVIFVVPETVTKDPSARFFSTDHIKASYRLFRRDDGSNRRCKLILLLLVFFFSTLPAFSLGTTTLFIKYRPLCWSDKLVGQFSAISTSISLVGGAVVAKLCKCCLPDEYIAIIVGFTAVIAKVFKAFVQNTAMMFIAAVIEAGGVIFIPTVRTLMSKLVGENEQGSVFGAIAFVESTCVLVSTSLFNAVYTATLSWWTGFVFITMGACYLIGDLFLAAYVLKTRKEATSRRYHRVVISESLVGEDEDSQPILPVS